MVPRPLAVTIIAWFSIIASFFAILGLWVFWKMHHHPTGHYLELQLKMQQTAPYPDWLSLLQCVAGGLISFVSGFFLLRGRSWARSLHVVYNVGSLVVCFFFIKWKPHIIPNALLAGVIIAFLFTPKANRYFSGTHVD